MISSISERLSPKDIERLRRKVQKDMAKKRPTPKKEGVLGGKDHMTRIRNRFAELIPILMELHQSDFSTEVNEAVRERLERFGLWPPPELKEQTKKKPDDSCESS